MNSGCLFSPEKEKIGIPVPSCPNAGTTGEKRHEALEIKQDNKPDMEMNLSPARKYQTRKDQVITR